MIVLGLRVALGLLLGLWLSLRLTLLKPLTVTHNHSPPKHIVEHRHYQIACHGLSLRAVPSMGGNANMQPCVFPFILDGVEYTDCIPTRPGFSWCSTTANYDKDHYWGYCPAGRMTGQ